MLRSPFAMLRQQLRLLRPLGLLAVIWQAAGPAVALMACASMPGMAAPSTGSHAHHHGEAPGDGPVRQDLHPRHACCYLCVTSGQRLTLLPVPGLVPSLVVSSPAGELFHAGEPDLSRSDVSLPPAIGPPRSTV